MRKNKVADILVVIAWVVYIGGFILGIVGAYEEVTVGTYYLGTEKVFSWLAAFTGWATAFITGTMFLGFAEIIKLLQRLVISNKK